MFFLLDLKKNVQLSPRFFGPKMVSTIRDKLVAEVRPSFVHVFDEVLARDVRFDGCKGIDLDTIDSRRAFRVFAFDLTLCSYNVSLTRIFFRWKERAAVVMDTSSAFWESLR